VLNRHFQKVTTWDENAIKDRGEKIAKEVAALWLRPSGGDYSPPTDEEEQELSQSERRQKRLEYWTDFLAYAQEQDGLPKLPKASRRGWLGCPIGRSGFRLLVFVNLARRYVGVALACRGTKGLENSSLLRN